MKESTKIKKPASLEDFEGEGRNGSSRNRESKSVRESGERGKKSVSKP